MKIRGLIFDVDGTLVNVEERFYHCYNKTLTKFGIDSLDRDTYEDKRRRGVLSDPISDDDEVLARFWLDFIDSFSYADVEDLGSPFPGVLEALDELEARGYKMAIVTGRTSVSGRVIKELHGMGIDGYFQLVLTNEDGIEGLNKASKLIECAQKLGFSPAECAYTGDWEEDIKSAREAGIGLVVAVLTGGEGKESLEKTDPDVILGGVAELPGFLSARSFS